MQAMTELRVDDVLLFISHSVPSNPAVTATEEQLQRFLRDAQQSKSNIQWFPSTCRLMLRCLHAAPWAFREKEEKIPFLERLTENNGMIMSLLTHLLFCETADYQYSLLLTSMLCMRFWTDSNFPESILSYALQHHEDELRKWLSLWLPRLRNNVKYELQNHSTMSIINNAVYDSTDTDSSLTSPGGSVDASPQRGVAPLRRAQSSIDTPREKGGTAPAQAGPSGLRAWPPATRALGLPQPA